MFKPYQSKPITRMAFPITDDMFIGKINKESTYFVQWWDEKGNYEEVGFKAYQVPVHGDYVCRLTAEDTYHVANAVFEERNIVE